MQIVLQDMHMQAWEPEEKEEKVRQHALDLIITAAT